MGRDGSQSWKYRIFVKFQSTRPHGARHRRRGRPAARACFNPRARMGRDRRISRFSSPLISFQSTRPHGARLISIWKFSHGRSFQSTRPHGARLDLDMEIFARSVVSIHAPAWGATHGFVCERVCRVCFNPRARMGRDEG